MIRSFADKSAEQIWRGQYVKGVDRNVQRAALRKLEVVDAAKVLADLRVPPGNRLEKLIGDRRGQHSIRVNAQWRICFVWRDGEQKMSSSLTTTELDEIEPIHPGEILMEDFIEGFAITQNRLAVSIGVPPRRINEIVHGKRGITADTAVRLARYFGTSEQFWMNLQSNYELRLKRRDLEKQLREITPLQVA